MSYYCTHRAGMTLRELQPYATSIESDIPLPDFKVVSASNLASTPSVDSSKMLDESWFTSLPPLSDSCDTTLQCMCYDGDFPGVSASGPMLTPVIMCGSGPNPHKFFGKHLVMLSGMTNTIGDWGPPHAFDRQNIILCGLNYNTQTAECVQTPASSQVVSSLRQAWTNINDKSCDECQYRCTATGCAPCTGDCATRPSVVSRK